MTSSSPKLIADIGGTHARFALYQNGLIQQEKVLNGADFDSFISACQHYLKITGQPTVKQAAIAIATPIDGDEINMTNHHWRFSIEAARQALNLEKLVFKNDFEALALSIPFLQVEDCPQIGGGAAKPRQAIGVLGPGTGLGVSGLIYAKNEWIPVVGEGGHVSFSPTTKREAKILEQAWQDYPHVSAERLISGPGLELIYRIVSKLNHAVTKADTISAKQISQKAMDGSDKNCLETLELFCGFLGTVAGNLALTLGAKGGIYIGGGIVPKLGDYFKHSPFREKFEAKGRFHAYLKEIPVFVIKADNPALIGISQQLD